MHRVERIELDLPEGSLPSLAQRFAQKTGQDPAPHPRQRISSASNRRRDAQHGDAIEEKKTPKITQRRNPRLPP